MNTARIKDGDLIDLIISCTRHKEVREFLRKNPHLISEFDIPFQIEQCVSNVSRIQLCENRRQKGMDLVDGTEVKYGKVRRKGKVNKSGNTTHAVTIGNLATKRGDIRVVVYNPYAFSGERMYFLYIPNEYLRLHEGGTITITVSYDKYTGEFDLTDEYKIFRVWSFRDLCLPIETSRRNFEVNKLLAERLIKDGEHEVVEAEELTLAFVEKYKERIADTIEVSISREIEDGNRDDLACSPKDFLIDFVEKVDDGANTTERMRRTISKIRSTSTASTMISSMWNYRKRRALAAA